MKVAVTGADGHVGANLLPALIAAGHTPRAVILGDRPAADLPDGIEIRRADVRDAAAVEAALAGTDAVMHVAGIVSIASRGFEAMAAVNTAGVAHVIAACRRHGIRRLVHFSTVDAVDPFPRDQPLDESRPLADWPLNRPYSKSKAAGERLVREAAAVGDLETVILAPTSCLGPLDFAPSLTGQTILTLAAGRMPALINAGFDWVDVRDVAASAVAALAAPAGNRYLLGGRYAPLRELAGHIVELTGQRRVPPVLPLWTAWLGVPFATAAAALTGARPVVTSVSLKTVGEAPRDVRHDAAARDLGHTPRPLRQTLADTLVWFARRNKLTLPKDAPAWQVAET
jgi:dihydroflavonol-4-reductase